MSILFKGNGISEFEPYAKKIFNDKCKNINFYSDLNLINQKEIKYLITWNPEKNIKKKLPNLVAIFTLGARGDSLGDIKKILKKINIEKIQNMNFQFFTNSNKQELNIQYDKNIYHKSQLIYQNFLQFN